MITALRGLDATLNPRNIVFLSPNVLTTARARSAVLSTDSRYYDPWGTSYQLAIDGDYNNSLANPYSANAGPATLGQGVIAWSLGKDKSGGTGDKNATTAKDDVISWQ